jgi:anti-sigma B factor antagonist
MSCAQTPSGFDATLRTERGVAIVEVSGELEARALLAFRSTCNQAIEAAGRPLLVLDVGRLEFLDAAGLGAMWGLRTRLRRKGGALVIAGSCLMFEKITRITGMTGSFPTASTVYEACCRVVDLATMTPTDPV